MEIIEKWEKQKQLLNYLEEKSEKMSRLKECIKNGEVKESVDCFVGAYEDMFDCSVIRVVVCAIADNGQCIELELRNEV